MAKSRARAEDSGNTAEKGFAALSNDLLAIEKWIAAGRLDGGTALEQVVAAIASIPAVSSAFIALNHEGTLQCAASAGSAPPAGEIVPSNVLFEECMQNHRMCRYQNAYTDPRVDADLQRQLSFASAILLPVKSRTVSGLLAVFSTVPNAIDEKDVFVLGTAATLAGHIASSLQEKRPEGDAEGAHANLLDRLGKPAKNAARGVPAHATQAVPVLPSHEKPTYSRSATGKATVAALVVLAIAAGLFAGLRLVQQKRVTAKAKLAPQTNSQIAEVLGPPALSGSKPGSVSAKKITGGTVQQRLLPAYPESALRDGVQREVRMIVTVNEKGLVSDVRILSGDPDLASAAADAIGHWRFSPFLANGQPTSVQLPLVIAFRPPAKNPAASAKPAS